MGETDVRYLIGRVQEALAQDASELGLDVSIAAKEVFVSGVVATPERKERVSEIVGATLPGYEVHNETTVERFADDEVVEDIS